MTFVSRSVGDTEALGARLALAAKPGSVFALRGGLGAGKTAMTRGIAKGLGVTAPVTSPTYTLVNEYEGDMPLYHMDAYRLRGADEFELLDAAAYLYGEGLCVVEWSERVADALPGYAASIEILPEPDGTRIITIRDSALEAALAEVPA